MALKLGPRFVHPAPRAGFSLIELLTVIALITVLVALVAPVSMQLLERVTEKIDTVRFAQFTQKASFAAFVRQQNCTILVNETEQEEIITPLRILCGEETLLEEELVFTEIASYLKVQADLPLTFNRMGLPLAAAGDQ